MEAVISFRLVYVGEEPPASYTASLFLAGPDSRTAKSWRLEALAYLEALAFSGVVFLPETRDGQAAPYEVLADWERNALQRADVIVWWLPHEFADLTRHESNVVEFGHWLDSGKMIVGTSASVPRNAPLRFHTARAQVPVATNLKDAIELAVSRIGPGAPRSDGERDIPLHVWQLPHFQSWYQSQKEAGNRLQAARLVWTFEAGPNREFTLIWAVHVDIYIQAENRHKTNEVVIGRPDLATVLLYRLAPNVLDSEIVLVREFRSQARTRDGHVLELPGGSTPDIRVEPRVTAAREAAEETGLQLAADRLQTHNCRQIAGSFSTHQAHLFSAALTPEEMDLLRADSLAPHGVLEDTERTFVNVRTLAEILEDTTVDWSTLGMILFILRTAEGG